MRIAVVGSGVSGLVCADLLAPHHAVTLYEQDQRAGGHAHTVRVDLPRAEREVDTGFLVYNERTYPRFTALLGHLGVATKPSDMSFSVSDAPSGVEWCGSSLSTLFAQRRNALDPAFLRMLRDVARFNRVARRIANGDGNDLDSTLHDLLGAGRWSREFVDWYLVPMGSAIWSADPSTFLDIPATTFARFFDNHGLLQLGRQPQWRTVCGGSKSYVDAIIGRFGGRLALGSGVDKVVRRPAAGIVELHTADGELSEFDHVVLATHSDQALRILGDATPAERDVLGAIRYQANEVTLHTDELLMPRARRAWASWNYHRLGDGADLVALTYHLQRLQGIASPPELFLTLNRDDAIDPSKVLRHFSYAHPVLDAAATRAQRRRHEISGRDGTSFAGAYWGAGFHEDGVVSALAVCRALGVGARW